MTKLDKLSSGETGFIHDWVYVIIPVENKPLFSAFCKQCRNYYTEFIGFLDRQPLYTESHLPKYGCNPVV